MRKIQFINFFFKTMAEYRRERCLTHPISFMLLNMKW